MSAKARLYTPASSGSRTCSSMSMLAGNELGSKCALQRGFKRDEKKGPERNGREEEQRDTAL
jgi:hypothetical protein